MHFISSRELSVLLDLVQAQIAISEWDFLPALLSIFSTSEKLQSWKGIHVLDNQVGLIVDYQPPPDQRRLIIYDLVALFFSHNFYSLQPEHGKGKIRSKMSLLDTIPLPELYQWMCKMMVILLSKVGIFYGRYNLTA